MQSRDPSKPGHPLASDIAKRLLVSATLGSLRDLGPNTSTIAVANLSMESSHVLSDILRYSSHESVAVPYASIRSAVVHFW